ncbi:ATP-binding protein [Amycolatopsis anabasis]|uniref:ATP-binding protein n=1 Tax=Amycolatopsis anabasis TaxID=1840409 RepID=UPI00131B012F|nr:ATP-binding protein [Amycolatopsis anabasis]
MNSQTAQVDDLRLVAMPNAVNCASMFVRFTLAEWSLRSLVPEVTTVTCGLVSAVVDAADPAAPSFLTVRLQVRGDRLVVEVEDDQPPRPSATAPVAGHHGGVVPLEGGGKYVWCELPLPEGMTAAGVALPRREARRSLVTEQMAGEKVEVEPEVVRRILAGLTKSVDG